VNARFTHSHDLADQAESGENRSVRPGGLRIIASSELFRGAQEIGIEHSGSLYRLKITRQGKLILNK
jgi:hemin uptake protein HemP